MRSIDQAGELLKSGQDVILYDCGGDAVLLAISGLDAYCGQKPTVLCDTRKELWGRRLSGIPICDPAEAARRHPNAWWLIANFLDKAFASRYLAEKLGIAPGKIINFTAYDKRAGCRYLENYFHVREGGLNFCCDAPDRLDPPRVVSGNKAAEAVTQLENFRRDAIKRSGQGTMCEHCSSMSVSFYPRTAKIELFNYGGGGICNFRCMYCNASARGKTHIEGDLDFVELFDALKRAGRLSEDVHVQFNAGEIGVHPKRAEMFAALDRATVSVLTNSSVYCPEIVRALALGRAIVNTSLDAGSRETFRRVKGADAWERVCGNLRQYAQVRKNNIVLKYILLPGVNDTHEEIDGFVHLCEECAGFVQISSDFRHPERVDETTWSAFDYLRAGLEAREILYRVSAGAFVNRK